MRFFVPLRMTPFNRKQGFSLLEMVIAIFIIAVVLGFSLIAMGKGMGLSAKSSDLTIATTIAEQEMARIKNIPFPPTTVDRQSEYPSLLPDDNSWPNMATWPDAPIPYDRDFRLVSRSEVYGYSVIDGIYEELLLSTGPLDDVIMLRKITIRVCRKRDNKELVNFVTYIARNGTI